MSKMKLQVVMLSSLLSSTAFAGTMGWEDNEVWPLVITLSGGPAWITGLDNQTITVEPDVVKTYTADNNDETLGVVELFVGWNSASSSSVQGQLGLAVVGTSSAALQGSIWEDANPNFDNFYYSFNVRHLHVAAKAKLVGDMGYNFMPYISGSLGYGYNRATNFSITPKIFQEVAAPAYTDSNTSTFTYTAGVGIEYLISSNWRMGLGYEFADWGKIELGLAPNQIAGSSYGINHLYTQQFQLSLSYFT
ncbi:outer membrane protein [Legionella hackeliae]|uniref:Outer membrane protein beta-barrel domain-containing protein n=1 Tax=Legionella hackeliae TaxID=449 RepID=A0A0A8UK14_LEGHA|nr:outer membrane beta-barrel protein [Legionella hackeliae]KTD12877.1 hypothetical protein Lhac_1748 [Legionella hackeliae]CEK09185.1 conserved exported protein of unknown function [Legionella hackeliae]STX49093.1 Opacity protein and related surface antigens [Legionella hackeliae]